MYFFYHFRSELAVIFKEVWKAVLEEGYEIPNRAVVENALAHDEEEDEEETRCFVLCQKRYVPRLFIAFLYSLN